MCPLLDRPGWIECRRPTDRIMHPDPHPDPATSRGESSRSLRCEPTLTATLDRMAIPPKTLDEAAPIARAWARKEAALWPDVEDGEPLGRICALSITPEYILVTVRTRRFRIESR